VRPGPRASVARRLVASLVAILSASSLVLVSSLVASEHRRLIADLRAQAAAGADRLVAALGFPVWNAYDREIEVQLDWAMADPALYGLELELADLSPALRARSRDRTWAPRADPPEALPGLLVERRDIIHEEHRIGGLALLYSPRFVRTRIAREAFRYAAIVLIADLSIAAGLVVVLRRWVVRPLERIERWAAEVSRGEAAPIPPEEGAAGEVASLRDSIERMVRLLGERYELIELKEREYRSLFESSPVAVWELGFTRIKAALGEAALSGEAAAAAVAAYPGGTRALLALAERLGANQAALAPLGGASVSVLSLLGEDAIAVFSREIACLASGCPGASGDCELVLPDGRRRSYALGFAALAGHEADWSRVILTATDITERVAAESRLRVALGQREALVQELFHRTRNGLQLASSLISLREGRSRDEALAAELRALRRRLRAMALAQDELIRGEDLSYVELGAYLGRLLEAILEDFPGAAGRIGVELEAEPSRVLIDVAMPIGLALTELVSNSLEHGIPPGRPGSIALSLRHDASGGLLLELGDDGAGAPPGFDPRRDAGLGLETCLAIVEGQLKGEASFSSSPGFRASIRLPSLDGGFERRV